MTFPADTPRTRGDRNAPHASPVTPDEDVRTISHQSDLMGAVLAGVAAALVIQLILNLLGIGLGAASFDPSSNNNPTATSFSITAGIWWAVSGIIAALLGGYTAGRLAGQPKESSGAWHGFTAWALTTCWYSISSAARSAPLWAGLPKLEQCCNGSGPNLRYDGSDGSPGCRAREYRRPSLFPRALAA